jgi:hypothetical protein
VLDACFASNLKKRYATVKVLCRRPSRRVKVWRQEEMIPARVRSVKPPWGFSAQFRGISESFYPACSSYAFGRSLKSPYFL